ncbi:ABC transporter permease subunit [Mariniblastus sp.]|nr:ABC transporter permease subunit [Mariniblastus sp.]
MKWPNVKLIFARELRDQLRDRRTLFTVVVMPIVLYPLMGMAMLQVAQFMREYPTKIWIIGHENLAESPSLVVDGEVHPDFIRGNEAELLHLSLADPEADELNELVSQFRENRNSPAASALVDQLIQAEMKAREIDVAVIVPSKIAFLNDQAVEGLDPVTANANSPPKIYVFQNSASDQSRIGANRIKSVIGRWQKSVIEHRLSANGIEPSMISGVNVVDADVADKLGKQTAIWSKLFPFIIMVWSLTGAFYPAIDLCAGEKERGTFETLLSSPAARSEIAIGKLLTVMSFSATTAVLNLISMAFTGLFVATRMGGMPGGIGLGVPPLASVGWLLLALIPISALFSAIALAAAAFARSSKEGQYYLVPLMMICMPLMMIPMMPSMKLDFGSSLIPVSGLMLFLRGLIEGQYAECLKFGGPVCIVTFACCWFAVRWVVHQFNSESVLFRPSERFGVGTWFRHIIRERHQLPSFSNAILCAVIILVAKFFIGFAVSPPQDFFDFAKITVIILAATIAVPALIMALLLTRSPGKSLKLNVCSPAAACAAVLLAVMLNPLFTWFTSLVMIVYPPSGDMFQLQAAVTNILGSAPNIFAILAVFALAPAIFEELAFRGFILSGMQSLRNKWQAILVTSLLFGIAHGVLQQSLITSVVGVVMAIIAVQTKSIFPCMLFHFTHNSMTVLLSKANAGVVESTSLNMILTSTDGGMYQYAVLPGICMAAFGIALLIWMLRLNLPEPPLVTEAARSFFGRMFTRKTVNA